MILEQQRAIELLHRLVAIPSLSTQEAAASTWLVEQMQQLGYDRTYVDGAGNAVGEIGAIDARRTLILLGHIDTVPGTIPVRIEASDQGPILFGRGSVDAKGPLATFTMAAAKVGSQWAHKHDLRIVVVGAVEEEYASSKGARFIRDRFNGVNEAQPIACVIGEPSAWTRVTLGYKGRLLVEMDASQPMAHTAGPDTGVATLAVDFWMWLSKRAAEFNQGRDKAFDQLQPSLRNLHTFTDEQMHDHVQAQAGIRLPLEFDVNNLVNDIVAWASNAANLPISQSPNLQSSVATPQSLPLNPEHPTSITLPGHPLTFTFTFRSYEPAWRSDRNTFLVRSFLSAIRECAPNMRPTLLTKTGTSDMNVVGPAWSCPVVAYGPGDASLDHTPNEHIYLDEYWQAIGVLETAIRALPELL